MLVFVLKEGGSALAFGFNVAVASLLRAEGAWFYFLALSVTAISSVIGRVGLDNALLRFVAALTIDWPVVGESLVSAKDGQAASSRNAKCFD